MKTKLRKRAGSLLFAMLMVLSSFNPYTAYGGTQAGSNDNAAGGSAIPATYNMHGWGAMVTLVSEENTYKADEAKLDELAKGYEGKDKTSVAITHVITEKYLENFSQFWLQGSTANNSCFIMISSSGKQFEATNKFVGTDGISSGYKIANSYRAVDGTVPGRYRM